MKTKSNMQRTLDLSRGVIALAGTVLFFRINGAHHIGMIAAWLAGFAALILWQSYARPRVAAQIGILALMLVYALVAPVLASGHGRSLIFLAGLLLPVTLVAAWLYFELRGRKPQDSA